MAGTLPSWGGNYFRNALTLTAVVELIAAAGLFIGGLYAPEARGGLWGTAAILGVVGFGLLAFGKKAGQTAANTRRLRAHGLPGTATITELTQTGLRVNDQPQVKLDLRVELEGRDPYMVSQKEIVPQAMLGVLTSGAPLAVRVDPDDLSNVLVLWDGGGPEAAAGLTESDIRKMVEERREAVRQNAMNATAVVRKIQDSDVVVGDYHVVKFEIELRFDDGRPSFTDEGNAAIPSAAFPYVRRGVQIPAQVNRDDPSLYTLDWNQVPQT